MPHDLNLVFSDHYDLNGESVATHLSAKSIHRGAAVATVAGENAARELMDGWVPKFLVKMTETAASLGAATLKVEVVQADNEGLTTNLEVLWASDAIALGTLVEGYRFYPELHVGQVTRNYLGTRYTVGTAEFTAGKVYAAMVDTIGKE